jgi:hypothetical protein
MNCEKFASDLPVHRTTVFISVEENEEAMQRYGVNQRMRQLGKGKFRSGLAVRGKSPGETLAMRVGRKS